MTADVDGAHSADLAAGGPQVAGWRLTRRLGVGAHGQVWLADDPSTGERVAVKLARDDLVGEQARQAEQRIVSEALMLARVQHPHVIRLHGRVPVTSRDGDGDLGVALVLDYLPGGSVADLVAARGPLDPGEVTTVVVPVARALAALHAAGIVHGDVTAANILLGVQGRPVLADLGTAEEARTVVAAGRTPPPVLSPAIWGAPGWADPRAVPGRPTPTQDSWGLGALIRFCLTASVSGVAGGDAAGRDAPDDEFGAARAAMVRLAQACCAEPDQRPSAAEVAKLVWQAASATPITMAEPVGPSAPELTRQIRVGAATAGVGPRPRRLRREQWRGWAHAPRPIWATAAIATAVLAGAGTALALSRAPSSEATAVSAASVSATSTAPAPAAAAPHVAASITDVDPAAVPLDVARLVTELAGNRAAALIARSTLGLAQVDAAGSAAETADQVLLQQLSAAGRHLSGLTFVVSQVQPVTAPAQTQRLTVTAMVLTSAHAQVDDTSSAVIEAVPAGRSQRIRLELSRTAAGWRVVTVQPVSG